VIVPFLPPWMKQEHGFRRGWVHCRRFRSFMADTALAGKRQVFLDRSAALAAGKNVFG
jgi:hypothetical protein